MTQRIEEIRPLDSPQPGSQAQAWDWVGALTTPRLVDFQAAARPEKVFLIAESEQVTFAALRERARQVAAALGGAGVRAGDRIAVHLPNDACWAYVVFGIHYLGAVAVMANMLYSGDELSYLLQHSQAKAVVTTTSGMDIVGSSAPAGVRIYTYDPSAPSYLADGQTGLPLAPGDPDAAVLGTAVSEDPATILYTSGTTARPKGVVYRHGNHVFAGKYAGSLIALREDDIHLCYHPLYHMGGQHLQLYPSLVAGATVVLKSEFRASRFTVDLAASGATVTSLVSQMIRAIVAIDTPDGTYPQSLRVSYLGMPLDDTAWDAFEARYGCPLLEEIGQTEIGSIPLFNPLHGSARKRRCAGLPGPGYSVAIVDEQGRLLPPSTPGELLIGCYSRFGFSAGYLDDPAATAELFRGGWLHTGDVATIDPDGYVTFVERLKNMIKRSGMNVAAAEVERVLDDHDDVAESAVVGVPDPFRDEAVVAFVTPVPGRDLTADGVREHCAARLAAFKVPGSVHIMPSLPRDFMGKVRRADLRKLAIEYTGDEQ
jgi:crotonobetaine/carnitine-CoA ligase